MNKWLSVAPAMINNRIIKVSNLLCRFRQIDINIMIKQIFNGIFSFTDKGSYQLTIAEIIA